MKIKMLKGLLDNGTHMFPGFIYDVSEEKGKAWCKAGHCVSLADVLVQVKEEVAKLETLIADEPEPEPEPEPETLPATSIGPLDVHVAAPVKAKPKPKPKARARAKAKPKGRVKRRRG